MRPLLQAFLATPEVRTLQRMGFKRGTLEIVIKHQLQKTGKLHEYDFFGIFFFIITKKNTVTRGTSTFLVQVEGSLALRTCLRALFTTSTMGAVLIFPVAEDLLHVSTSGL